MGSFHTISQKPAAGPPIPQTTPLTIKQLREYPLAARSLKLPEATSHGKVEVGAGRDGPFALHYQLFGHGPSKILWLCGHGDTVKNWTRYVRHFGFENYDKYSSLVLDHRGTGESEGPWSIWWMKSMAKDCLDALDQLQWTADRSIHIVGHSMGGMIAQEMAVLAPNRVASLTLLATTSHWTADWSLLAGAKAIASALVPRFENARLAETKATFFGQSWLNAPDELGIFPTNGDAWAARSYLEMDVQYRGAILQMPACVRHHVPPAGLNKAAMDIGGDRIMILHGTADKILPVQAAERIYSGFGGDASGVQLYVYDDVGHLLPIEKFGEVVQLLEKMTDVCRQEALLREY